jgi:hypothetical protein
MFTGTFAKTNVAKNMKTTALFLDIDEVLCLNKSCSGNNFAKPLKQGTTTAMGVKMTKYKPTVKEDLLAICPQRQVRISLYLRHITRHATGRFAFLRRVTRASMACSRNANGIGQSYILSLAIILNVWGADARAV